MSMKKKNVRACVAGNGTLNCARVEIVLMNGKINNSISDRFLPVTRADDDYSTQFIKMGVECNGKSAFRVRFVRNASCQCTRKRERERKEKEIREIDKNGE